MLPPQRQEEEKSPLRSFAEQQAKRQGGKLARKLGKKAGKLAIKLAKMAAKKFAVILGKMLVWLVGAVGVPTLIIGFCIIVAVLVVSFAWSFMLGTGEGLSGDDQKTYEYIVSEADKTVDMKSSIEKPYRVPEKLIAATIQLDAFSKNDDITSIISNMAKSLAPDFTYGQYDEWNEKQVTVCEDNVCKEGEVQHTPKMVKKLENVDYWNGSTTFTYTPHVSDWKTTTNITYKTVTETTTKKVVTELEVPKVIETCTRKIISEDPPKYVNECKTETIYVTETETKYVPVQTERKIEVKTITKTRYQYFTSTKSTRTDYATFDSVLNSYGLGLEDKKLIEANYIFMGGTIAYTEWLTSNGTGLGGGFTSFDGTITPGGGVPPQFMPYYLSAEKKYGVHWYTLAAIHFVETGFSTHPTMISSAGAIGHFQFLPATWVGWSYNVGGGRVSSSLDITSLAVIAQGRGYGTDGNNDGKADPFNVEDSVHTAAKYLSSNGYSTDPRNAIWHYNHAEWYVNKVLTNAENFKNAAVYEANSGDIPPLQPGSFMRPASGPVSSQFGARWGTTHFGTDISSGGKSNVPIVASADGVVSKSYYSGSYGNVVFIKHNIGGQVFETVYAHMVNRGVAEGATVKQGQYIGTMGTTGDSTGVHLHFEVHKNAWTKGKENAINPALVVPF